MGPRCFSLSALGARPAMGPRCFSLSVLLLLLQVRRVSLALRATPNGPTIRPRAPSPFLSCPFHCPVVRPPSSSKKVWVKEPERPGGCAALWSQRRWERERERVRTWRGLPTVRQVPEVGARLAAGSRDSGLAAVWAVGGVEQGGDRDMEKGSPGASPGRARSSGDDL